ncbi:MAG: protease [Sulfuricurvum sp. PC08-66]|nr:MAG: protease [Sulfuricurvum sp. PC08-66]
MSAPSSSIPKYATQTLDNGLQVVVVPMPNGTSVVSCDVLYKVGSGNEVMGKSGIAHMLEHLNFKSTKNLAAGDFDVEVKKYGGVNNASTSFDQTHYFIRSSKANLGRSLELFAELMQNLSLKEEEFLPERDVVAEERRWRTDNNPMGYLYFKLFNLAFEYHPYHWTPIGFMNDIQTWDIEDIRAFHAMYYQPQNAVIVLSGDISTDEAFALARKHFGAVANRTSMVRDNIIDTLRTDMSKPHFVEPPQEGAKRAIIEKESEVEMLAIAFKTPNYAHEDQFALSTISELLSAGKTGRLYQRIVDEKQLANQIYGYNMELLDPGLFIIIAVCNAGVDATIVEAEIWKELEKLKKKALKEAELAKVKRNIHSDFVFAFESASNVSDFIGSYFVKGNPAIIDTIEAKMQAVSAQDIQRVAQTYFVEKISTTLILKNPKEPK